MSDAVVPITIDRELIEALEDFTERARRGEIVSACIIVANREERERAYVWESYYGGADFENERIGMIGALTQATHDLCAEAREAEQRHRDGEPF